MPDAIAPPSFSAALLAGGASTRMGRDKALLNLPESGELLWQHQWRTLEELRPAEMFWSGLPRPGLPANARLVSDLVARAGPLAGIAACLEITRTDLLVVLAIDLPQISAAFLIKLLRRASSESGAIVEGPSYFEPLAAIYPKTLASLARKHLAEGRHALQDFVRAAVTQGALQVVPLRDEDRPLFQNLNHPSDLENFGT